MFLCIRKMVNAILSRRRITAPRGERAADVILEGIKRNDWRVRPSAAPELGAALAERGEIAYWVVAPESEPTPSRRAASRERTRLRPAELLDAALRFGCEHGICDRSLTNSGSRWPATPSAFRSGRLRARSIRGIGSS